MVHQHHHQQSSVLDSLVRSQSAPMGSAIGVSGPRSLPRHPCVGRHDPGRDPTDP